MVKNLPTMQETWVWSLGQEDLLEKQMATFPSVVAWKTPWTEEPGGLQSMGLQTFRNDWATEHIRYHNNIIVCALGRLPSFNGLTSWPHFQLFNIELFPLMIVGEHYQGEVLPNMFELCYPEFGLFTVTNTFTFTVTKVHSFPGAPITKLVA